MVQKLPTVLGVKPKLLLGDQKVPHELATTQPQMHIFPTYPQSYGHTGRSGLLYSLLRVAQAVSPPARPSHPSYPHTNRTSSGSGSHPTLPPITPSAQVFHVHSNHCRQRAPRAMLTQLPWDKSDRLQQATGIAPRVPPHIHSPCTILLVGASPQPYPPCQKPP